MGSTLIGLMARGPHLLDASKKDAILADVQERLGRVRDAAAGDLEAVLEHNFPRFLQRERDAGADIDEIAEILAEIRPGETQEMLEQVFRLWSGGDCADAVICTYPDSIVLFCGASSWGEEPDGLGYETLRDARDLGMLAALDIY